MGEQLNTVVSGRYFAGMWKCFLCRWIGLISFIYSIQPGRLWDNIATLLMIWVVGSIFLTIWYLHADAVNLRKTHGLEKGAWPYWIAFMFIGYWSVLIYYWTRNRLIGRAVMTQESLTWKDRILPYENRNNIPSLPTKWYGIYPKL